MEIIQGDVKYLGMCPSEEDAMLIHIENCARKCWKSEHLIDHNNRSFEKFYNLLLNVGHLSAIEHSNLVIEYEFKTLDAWSAVVASFTSMSAQKRSLFRIIPEMESFKLVISGNLRAWNEFIANEWSYFLLEDTALFLNEEYPILFSKVPEYLDVMNANRDNSEFEDLFDTLDNMRESIGDVGMRVISDIEQSSDPSYFLSYDIPIFTFDVVCDRGISHELVRHRVFSYSQESTRFVNYAKRNGMQLIDFPVPDVCLPTYLSIMKQVESLYNLLLENGVKPQYARNVLPTALKTEIAISGRISGWANFWRLRNSEKAHPDIRSIAKVVGETFNFSED